MVILFSFQWVSMSDPTCRIWGGITELSVLWLVDISGLLLDSWGWTGRGIRSWVPFQYPRKTSYREVLQVSKLRDLYLEFSDRFEIWQAHRQHCCWGACQISERSDNSKYKSRGFETLCDLMIRHLSDIETGPRVLLSYRISLRKSS